MDTCCICLNSFSYVVKERDSFTAVTKILFKLFSVMISNCRCVKSIVCPRCLGLLRKVQREHVKGRKPYELLRQKYSLPVAPLFPLEGCSRCRPSSSKLPELLEQAHRMRQDRRRQDSNLSSASTPSLVKEASETPYNLRKLPNFALQCIRYRISHRAASALATALMQDLDLISEDERTEVIESHRRELNATGLAFSTAEDLDEQMEDLTFIGFDSKNEYMVPCMVGGKDDEDKAHTSLTYKTVHHLSLTAESGCELCPWSDVKVVSCAPGLMAAPVR